MAESLKIAATGTASPDELERLVKRSSDNPSLNAEEFVECRRAGRELQQYYLAEQHDAKVAAGDFAGAYVCNTNGKIVLETLAKIAARQISLVNSDASVDSRVSEERIGELTQYRQRCRDLAKLAEGRAQYMLGLLERTLANYSKSAEALSRSVDAFAGLGETSHVFALADLLKRIVGYSAKVSKTLEFIHYWGDYRAAQIACLEARGAIEKLLQNPDSLATLSQQNKPELLKGIEADLLNTSALSEIITFVRALREGDFSLAACAVNRHLAILTNALTLYRQSNLPAGIMRIMEGELVSAQMLAAYARAELLIDDGEWKEAAGELDSAHSFGVAAAATAIASELPQGRALAERVQTSTGYLLSAALRRLKREQVLRRRIADLERDLADARTVIVKTQGGDFTMAREYENRTLVNTVYGDGNVLNVAESIRGVTNSITNNLSRSVASGEVQELVQTLLKQIEVLAKDHPSTSKQMASDIEVLSREIASETPRRRWYEVSLEGLKEAAQAVGDLGKPILETVKALVPLLLP